MWSFNVERPVWLTTFVFSSVASQWHEGCWLGKNNGGLALPFSEHKVVDLLNAGLNNRETNEFWSSSRRFPRIGMAPLDI
jgi:hypothetical protein